MAGLCLAVFATAPVAAQDVQALADRLLAGTGAPAAAVGVFRDGSVEHGVAGLRARGHDAGVTPGDLWHIGSNTKSMTAMLVGRLVEAGDLRWEDTLGDRLADLDPHPGYADVTFLDLLSHRSGLPANAGMLTMLRLAGADADRDVVADRRTYARSVLKGAPGPREEHYSNAGYVVAGAMIEAATGESWETLMRREVFAPLGLDSAGFGPPGVSTVAPDQPWGHGGLLGGTKAPGAGADNPPALGPAGRVHLSVIDHLRYLRAHLERPRDFLSSESWDLLQGDVAGQGYGLGWGPRDGVLSHNGSNTFWLNRVEVHPDRGLAIVLAVNDGRIEAMMPVFRDIAAEITAH